MDTRSSSGYKEIEWIQGEVMDNHGEGIDTRIRNGYKEKEWIQGEVVDTRRRNEYKE